MIPSYILFRLIASKRSMWRLGRLCRMFHVISLANDLGFYLGVATNNGLNYIVSTS